MTRKSEDRKSAHSMPENLSSTSTAYSMSNTSPTTDQSSCFSTSPESQPLSLATSLPLQSPHSRKQKRRTTDPLPSPTKSMQGNTSRSPTEECRESHSQKRKSGAFTDVGRHSNDWLFNGFSVTETVKGVLSRKSTDNSK